MTKICLVTGSSRGIGLSIALSLAEKGYQVILNSRRPIEQATLDLFKSFDCPVAQVVGDVSQFETAQQMIDEIMTTWGRLDVLVNNAGITRDQLLMRMTEEDFDSVININLKGPFNLVRHAIRPMMRQREGTIINLASVSGLIGNAGQVNYSASKAGLIGLTKSLAREVGSRSITVNAIAPGFIETDMTDELNPNIREAVLNQIPLNRFGQPEEIAKAVCFLIENRYITGQTLTIDGGLSMQ